MKPIEYYIPTLSPLYCEPHRHYHSLKHIHSLVRLIKTNDYMEFIDYSRLNHKALNISQLWGDNRDAKEFLLYVAWFHDAIYDPYAINSQNEIDSCNLFCSLMPHTDNLTASDVRFIEEVATAIIATGGHTKTMFFDDEEDGSVSAASLLFLDLDLYGFSLDDDTLLQNSKDIKAEYYQTSEIDYIYGRISFLEAMLGRARIYYIFNDATEARARANIEKELSRMMNQKDAYHGSR